MVAVTPNSWTLKQMDGAADQTCPSNGTMVQHFNIKDPSLQLEELFLEKKTTRFCHLTLIEGLGLSGQKLSTFQDITTMQLWLMRSWLTVETCT